MVADRGENMAMVLFPLAQHHDHNGGCGRETLRVCWTGFTFVGVVAIAGEEVLGCGILLKSCSFCG